MVEAWAKAGFDKEKVDMVIAPIAIHLNALKPPLEAMGAEISAQNCSKTGSGAFTGEWTADQLTDCGITWTIIGHSERRTKYGETDADTGLKVELALKAGQKVILCIGEVLEEREGGKTDEVNKRMLDAVIPKVTDWSKMVIAYEPVWAIGTGKVATPEQAEETQAAIRSHIKAKVNQKAADEIRIQYGGSVSPENCKELISKPNIDGFLVGGASLKPTFIDIVKACQ